MSHYEWERGTVTIPAAEWAAFKKALRDGYNRLREQDFETLTKIHAKVAASCKGVAPNELQSLVATEVARVENANTWTNFKKLVYEFNLLDSDECRYLLVKQNAKSSKFQLVKPSLKDFPLPAAGRTTTAFAVFDDASVTLDNKNRTVTWRVPEGNHAVERARESEMGRLFFRLLSKITWTRGSGGTFLKNDEENRNDESAGCGGDYVSARYGTKAELDKQFNRAWRQ